MRLRGETSGEPVTSLRELVDSAGIPDARIEGNRAISSLVSDSRRVAPGALFVCMPRGEAYLGTAVQRGANAALVSTLDAFEQALFVGLAAVYVPGGEEAFAEAVWRVCDAFYEHPTRYMKVVGVTGTNGKTTTAWLIRDMLRGLEVSAGYLGTLGFQVPGIERELPNTTPFAVETYGLLGEARDAGVEVLAMEVSSHALAQHRADGIEFDAGIFTNLTQDHLDFHGTMEAYEAAKLRLFTDLPRLSSKPFMAVLNRDEPASFHIADRLSGPCIWFSEAFEADVWASEVAVSVDRISMTLRFGSSVERYPVAAPLGGGYNVQNLLAAVAGLVAIGYSPSEVASVVGKVRPVPGRFEPVANECGIGVLVDYAHTPDALEKLLRTVRSLKSGRVITVFGCGGDRDRGKRPLMAAVASSLSDLTVITSDNPRTEDPSAILSDIASGMIAGASSVSILDRGDAVLHAVTQAVPGDVVVLAGKGHENYQIIGREKIHMDDRELARAGFAARGCL